MSETPPPPVGGRWNDWGERINSYLVRNLYRLPYLRGGESAADDGIFGYDPAENHVVLTRSGKYEPLAYGHNSHMLAYTNATHSAASADTAYAITWESNPITNHVEVDGTTTSRINFEKEGTYKVDFSAELLSGSASSKTIYIFPRINGVDISNSGVVETVKDNGHRHAVTRSGMFSVSAGDYLEAIFAVTDTDLTIDGSAATAFSPACPSAIIIVTQVDV